jgi:uncharacterized protein YfaP (DUF2135 family)
MKSIMKLAVVALVVILAVSAFAGNIGNLRLNNDTTVSGTKLAAGEYKVTVDGTGPEVKVIFAQDGKVKATVSGKLATEAAAPEYSSVVINKAGDKAAVTELRLAKMKGVVKFD